MDKTKKIVTMAMLISVLSCSQSQAYTGNMDWDNFKAKAAAGETTRKNFIGGNNLKYECKYNHNKDGVCKKFYKNGHVAKESTSSNNGQNVTYRTFFENGGIASESRYIDSLRNGKFKQFYWSSASALSYRQPSSESSYKDGYRHGVSKTFSPNGALTWSQNYN
jgi:antitoxin component YwqK of YwqJK toxin-antitoxin module